jgi:TRAP-type mannitol/chloroaromatic compound transport system permease large subunit
VLVEVMRSTLRVTSMVFVILIGAQLFNLTFRGLGGDETVREILDALPGGPWGAMVAVMLLIFVLGFFLDFIEIVFVVVPITAPVIFSYSNPDGTIMFPPVWVAVMMAMNLQTSFLTPPFGFALFYLRGVAPPEIRTIDIYRGVIPFVIMQLLMLAVLAAFPALATWLPSRIFG